ncbi:MAG: hypothetical protein ACE5ES_01595 [Candidatus Nanoarchaeia archaeon]
MTRQTYVIKEPLDNVLGKLWNIPDSYMRLSGGKIINYEIGHCIFTIKLEEDNITAEINSMDGSSRLNKAFTKIKKLTELDFEENGN